MYKLALKHAQQLYKVIWDAAGHLNSINLHLFQFKVPESGPTPMPRGQILILPLGLWWAIGWTKYPVKWHFFTLDPAK